MNNQKEFITPNEINKFVYCPYQWYYEKKYGKKQIYALYKERNKALGLTNSRMSHFQKGNQFHKEFPLQTKGKFLFWFFFFLALAIVFIYVYVRFYQ